MSRSVLELAVGGLPLARERLPANGWLDLERHVTAIIVHRSQFDELGVLPGWAAERTVVLDMGPSTPSEWASAARVAAEQKR